VWSKAHVLEPYLSHKSPALVDSPCFKSSNHSPLPSKVQVPGPSLSPSLLSNIVSHDFDRIQPDFSTFPKGLHIVSFSAFMNGILLCHLLPVKSHRPSECHPIPPSPDPSMGSFYLFWWCCGFCPSRQSGTLTWIIAIGVQTALLEAGNVRTEIGWVNIFITHRAFPVYVHHKCLLNEWKQEMKKAYILLQFYTALKKSHSDTGQQNCSLFICSKT
jgi:hypothetical protein